MSSGNEKLTPARKRWLLFGGIAVFVVAFSLLESLVGTDSTPSEPEADEGTWAPEPPEVRRLEDGEIEIRHDFFRRSSYRMADKKEEQLLFDCLEKGIEETFGEGTTGWDRERVRSETRRIQNHCVGLPAVPTVPEPPRLEED